MMLVEAESIGGWLVQDRRHSYGLLMHPNVIFTSLDNNRQISSPSYIYTNISTIDQITRSWQTSAFIYRGRKLTGVWPILYITCQRGPQQQSSIRWKTHPRIFHSYPDRDHRHWSSPSHLGPFQWRLPRTPNDYPALGLANHGRVSILSASEQPTAPIGYQRTIFEGQGRTVQMNVQQPQA